MQWKRENDLPQTIGGIGLGTGLSLLHSSVIRSSTTCSVALVQSADVYSTPVGGARWRNQPRKATSSLYRTELEQLRHAVMLSCENVTDLVNLPPPFYWKVRTGVWTLLCFTEAPTVYCFFHRNLSSTQVEPAGNQQKISCSLFPGYTGTTIPENSRNGPNKTESWYRGIVVLSRHTTKSDSGHHSAHPEQLSSGEESSGDESSSQL